MKMQPIAIDDIVIGPRARSLRPEHVSVLADSIGEIGLQQPITVVRHDLGFGRDGFALVSGHHRLRACKSLGLVEIEANIVDMTELDRQLWEIDENLIRAELTELERGEHLARRKDIYIARHPETRQGGTGRAGYKNDNLSSFSEDAATKIGVTERTVERSVRRAEKICGKAKELIRGTETEDSGVELDALAAMTPDNQVRAAKLVSEGKAESIRDAKRLINPHRADRPVTLAQAPLGDLESIEKQLASLMSAWNRAGPDARAKFLEMVDEPVFDNTSNGRGDRPSFRSARDDRAMRNFVTAPQNPQVQTPHDADGVIIEQNAHASDLYGQAVAAVVGNQNASVSFVQRKLSLGYNAAARLVERMEAEGIVSRPNQVGKRECLLNEQNIQMPDETGQLETDSHGASDARNAQDYEPDDGGAALPEATSVAPAPSNPGEHHVTPSLSQKAIDTPVSSQALPGKIVEPFQPDPSNKWIKNIGPEPEMPAFLKRATTDQVGRA